MGYQKIGESFRRLEDERLLTGKGHFSDDWNRAGQAWMAVVRSPHAHALLKSVDTSDADALPGVLGVFAGADCDGLSPIPHNPSPSTKHDMKLHGPGGGEVFYGDHMPLPSDKARYVGEALAIVVAESLAQAEDAVEAVNIVYEPLPPVSRTDLAAAPGAAEVWDAAPGNICVETFFGDREATNAAFAAADHVVEMQFHQKFPLRWPPFAKGASR